MDCADVADCIENDAGVQAAIQALYSPSSPDVAMPPVVVASNILPAIIDCDKDELYGATKSLYFAMNRNNMDMFEIMEVVSNVGERASKLISAIPIVGLFPVDEVIDYAQALLTDDVFEAYLAADTEGYQQIVACQLMCIAISNGCELSLDDIGEYFSGRLGASWTDTLADILIFLTAGVWVGTEINDTFFLLQSKAMQAGNKFLGALSISPYTVYLASGTPSDEWETVCDLCLLCWLWDFSLGELAWDAIDAVYVTDVGFSDVTTDVTKVVIRYDFATPTLIETIQFHASHADLFVDIEVQYGVILSAQFRAANADDTWGYTLIADAVEWIEITMRRSLPDFADITLLSVQMELRGDDPATGELCE